MALLAILTFPGAPGVISMNRGNIGVLTAVLSTGENYLSLPSLGGPVDYPAETDVRDGIDFGDGLTGNLTLPLETNVLTGIQYGANGTELTGEAIAGGGEQSHVF